jgi:hypothetical protein
MNLKQLELKRLRELLGAVRKGRHMAQAMRTPVARLLRFDRATASGINRIRAKWEGMGLPEPIDEWERTFEDESIELLRIHASELAKREKKVLGRIIKLEKDPLLKAPAREVKAARRKKAASREKAEERLRATVEKRMAVVDEQAREDFARLHADAQRHPRAIPEQWLVFMRTLEQAYFARRWGPYDAALRLIASMGSPTDLEVLSRVLARARNVVEGGTPRK